MAFTNLTIQTIKSIKQTKFLISYIPKRLNEAYNKKTQYQQIKFLHIKMSAEDNITNMRNLNKIRLGNIQTIGRNNTINGVPEQIKSNILDSDAQIENDPNVFGKNTSSEFLDDEGDRSEEQYGENSSNYKKKHRNIDYARQIKRHLNNENLTAALDVLETQMLKFDRVKPDNYIYSLLISGCAQKGYTRKAFKLYNKMRQSGLKVKPGIYSALFNACAHAPTLQDGLNRAMYLREKMLEYGYQPNEINYNAMIKAYGRCGDVKTAFILADEMKERNLKLGIETFNFLLQACASDKKFGFRQCLDTWHKLLKTGLKPDYYTFTTVLRCVRDCGFGDLELLKQFLIELNMDDQTLPNIEKITSPQKLRDMRNTNPIQDLNFTQKDEMSLSISTSSELQVPNLLVQCPKLGNLISLDEIKEPYQRFLLIGGLNGYLKLMKLYNVTPDIQLFTSILEVLPPTKAAEKQVINWIQKIGLKVDMDFFNILMKRRSLRFDYAGAKEILLLAESVRLRPDIVTYGVLALGCRTVEEARELLETMKSKGIRMNIEILGAMLRQGTAQKEFSYVTEILQISLDENIKPNEIFLRHLNKFYDQNAHAIDARYSYTKSKKYKNEHTQFCKKLRTYFEENGIAGLKLTDAIKKIQERPYEQYQETVEGLEHNKNQKHLKKSKLRKHIKKIKLQNLSNDTAIKTALY